MSSIAHASYWYISSGSSVDRHLTTEQPVAEETVSSRQYQDRNTLEMHLLVIVVTQTKMNNIFYYILKQWIVFFARSDWLLKVGISSAIH